MPNLLLPGLIDCHVHLREPGLTHKGDMETETLSAIAGGVFTVCDMPNTIPPTVTVAALRDKVERASRIKDCDIHFYFGITQVSHIEELRHLLGDASLRDLRARCCGIKLFLDHSTGNQMAEIQVIEGALRVVAEHSITAVCHCEDAATNAYLHETVKAKGVEAHSSLRPPESEKKAIETILLLARKTGAHVHPTHLSTKEGVAFIRSAKNDGVSVTCDVTPHHLFLSIDDYRTAGVLAKMNPPLRTIDHRDALWTAIADGTVDCIATDHAPHTLEEKQNPDPLSAPSGVPGVETMLPLLLTVAAGGWPHPTSKRPTITFTYEDIARLCFENPNRIFSLGKKSPKEGGKVLHIDPSSSWVIHGKNLHSKCGWTPYEGWHVTGKLMKS